MNIHSKLTLYDSLAMFAIGLLLIFVTGISGFLKLCALNSVYSIAILSILAYILGFIFHSLWESILGILFKLPTLKICSGHFGDVIASFQRNSPDMIERAKRKVCEERRDESVSTIYWNECYLTAYYNIMKHGMLGSIPTLEAHEAFFRNLVPIFTIAIFTLRDRACCWLKLECWSYMVLMVVILILLLLIHAKVQRKIFESVWEGDFFLRKMCNNTEKAG